MELTIEQINYVYSRKDWSNDTKQDVLLKALEYTGINIGTLMSSLREEFVPWITRVGQTIQIDATDKVRRRAELQEENTQSMGVLHSDSDTNDPLQHLEAEEMVDRINDLSPLLRDTLGQYIDGYTGKEIAEDQGVEPNVIRRRINKIKEELN